VLQLCRRGLTFEVASEGELAGLRTALEPVYAELTADPATKSYLDAITNLKTELAASAEAPACTSTEPPTTASPIPDGTYEATLTGSDWQALTEADWLRLGVSKEDAVFPGVYTMIFDAGEWTFVGPTGDGELGSYTVFRDQIEVDISEDWSITARWSVDGTVLTFTDVKSSGEDGPNVITVIWESHPWVKTD
jgi:hypothetical protein